MTQSYAGDVDPTTTWHRLEADPDAVLIDVRTRAEWNYVGLPDLTPLGKQVLRIEWQIWPEGSVNPGFADEVASAGVGTGQPVYLICRSGARSRSAAQLLTQHGYSAAFNVADGFEGPHDEDRHRGRVAGWKHDGLPWTQG
jgi:rhodanese-related sulfurtransferase